jgi:hypothetical protein
MNLEPELSSVVLRDEVNIFGIRKKRYAFILTNQVTSNGQIISKLLVQESN